MHGRQGSWGWNQLGAGAGCQLCAALDGEGLRIRVEDVGEVEFEFMVKSGVLVCYP